jgi:hypothetical protein
MSKLTRAGCFVLGGYLLHLVRGGEEGRKKKTDVDWYDCARSYRKVVAPKWPTSWLSA